jgi:hypothetical protein
VLGADSWGTTVAHLVARQYARVHGEDPPDIVRWTWMQRRPDFAPGRPGGAADGQ